MGQSWPAPERRHLEKSVETEGWDFRGKVRGSTGDHYRYELHLPTGELLWTKISHPPGKKTYGPDLWDHILNDQLKVSPEQFWDCVNNGNAPSRAKPRTHEHEAIPIGVVNHLVNRFHVPESEVMALTKEEAIEMLARLFSRE